MVWTSFTGQLKLRLTIYRALMRPVLILIWKQIRLNDERPGREQFLDVVIMEVFAVSELASFIGP